MSVVTLCSIFRDSAGYLDRYMAQVANLRAVCEDVGLEVRCAWAEGDSTDGTYDLLEQFLEPGDFLVKIDHGGPRFPSVDHPQRWDQIAQVVSGLLGKVTDPGNALIWVEADLIWTPETMIGLYSDLFFRGVLAVAPMVYAQDTARFYDNWGFRKDGVRFEHWPPYFPAVPVTDDPLAAGTALGSLVPIDSCGSCFVVCSRAYDRLFSWTGHWPYTAGGGLWLDTELSVRHP